MRLSLIFTCVLFHLSAATTEFYFVRHAQSEMNTQKHIIGGDHPWAEITELGVRQAKAVGRRLQRIEFDAVYASDTVRTLQTARYFLNERGSLYPRILRDSRLKELYRGDWEGKVEREKYTPDVIATLNWNFVPGDDELGESPRQVAQRMVDWVDEKRLEHPNQRILVFSHGFSIRCLLGELLNLDRDSVPNMSLRNASITILRFEDDAVTCPTLNDISHLVDAANEPGVQS